jgi:hypothetical protein
VKIVADDSKRTPRELCYHGIRHKFVEVMAKFYRANPSWFDDERGRKANAALLELCRQIENLLDTFEIEAKK